MELEEVERLIEDAIPDASAEVTAPRPNDDEHLAVTVVSSAFEGKSLVEQHEMVFDAVGEHMTTDIHALKVTTRAPGEIEVDVED
ncbi:MAG: BolA family protein [Halobacteriales archaeon]